MTTTSENKLKFIELNDERELKVQYTERIKKFPPQKVEFHGEHYINEDDVDIELVSVKREIMGKWVEILNILSKKEKEEVIEKL